MSETSNDTVAQAFDGLVQAMKDSAFSTSSSASDLGRIIGYIQAVAPLVENWKAGKPASGKEAGKRGRKPKDKGQSGDEAVAA